MYENALFSHFDLKCDKWYGIWNMGERGYICLVCAKDYVT